MKKLAFVVVTGLAFGLFGSSAFAEPTKSAPGAAVVASRPAAANAQVSVLAPVKDPIHRLPVVTAAQREIQKAQQDEKRAAQDSITAGIDHKAAAKEQKIAKQDAQNGNARGALAAEMASKHLATKAAKDEQAAVDLRHEARMLRKEAIRDGFRVPRHQLKLIHR
ncbi:MAG: hypothetical protein U0441_35325 [Polyangiaceae bacterium]